MGVEHIREAKKLKTEFVRLGRAGISERAIHLMNSYIAENTEHNYKEITKLIGRFHALYLSIDNYDYWKEIANRGYVAELREINSFEPNTKG